MSNQAMDEEEQGEVFLDESDIIHEVDVDEEGILFFNHSLSYSVLNVCIVACCFTLFNRGCRSS